MKLRPYQEEAADFLYEHATSDGDFYFGQFTDRAVHEIERLKGLLRVSGQQEKHNSWLSSCPLPPRRH